MIGGMSVYSMDLRRKVVAASGTLAEVGRRFGVDPRTVRAWRRLDADGRLGPRRGGNPGTHPRLGGDGLALLRREVEARPGVTLRELADLLGRRVAESTVCRALLKLGYRHKKRAWRRGNA